MSTLEIKADAKELSEFLDGLLSELANAPDEVRKLSLDFIKFPSELVSFESSLTAGAEITVSLKPSQRLIDLSSAIRTGNFDFMIVEHPHSFSFVGNGLVELPILSTLEKLPITEEEIKD